MKPAVLQAELFEAAARVRQPHLDHMVGLGVSAGTIATLGRDQVSFGVGDALGETSGLYQPGDGPAHIVMPVSSDGVLVDLVAWRSLKPESWRLRCGNGWAINSDDLLTYDRWGDPPPMLYATPLDWLRSGCTGCVILDWDAPEIASLREHGQIDCDTDRTARMLRDAIAKTVRMPKILVDRSGVQLAA